jgi:hypothetical protein
MTHTPGEGREEEKHLPKSSLVDKTVEKFFEEELVFVISSFSTTGTQ